MMALKMVIEMTTTTTTMALKMVTDDDDRDGAHIRNLGSNMQTTQ